MEHASTIVERVLIGMIKRSNQGDSVSEQKNHIITEKMFTPNLNNFVKYVIDTGPSPTENGLLCVVAIMDEHLQILMKSKSVPDGMKKHIQKMYLECDMYLNDKVEQN